MRQVKGGEASCRPWQQPTVWCLICAAEAQRHYLQKHCMYVYVCMYLGGRRQVFASIACGVYTMIMYANRLLLLLLFPELLRTAPYIHRRDGRGSATGLFEIYNTVFISFLGMRRVWSTLSPPPLRLSGHIGTQMYVNCMFQLVRCAHRQASTLYHYNADLLNNNIYSPIHSIHKLRALHGRLRLLNSRSQPGEKVNV